MKKIFLNDSKNYLTIYYKDEMVRPCVLILPGGGYQYTSPRESEPVAKEFLAMGLHAAILNYREAEYLWPKPYQDTSEAVGILRADCLVNKTKIVGLGFSAGGHAMLAGTIYGENKVDYLALCYPVVTADAKYAHQGSVLHLLGEENLTPSSLEEISLEKHIDSSIPDTFLWHTFTDESVPVENSLLLVRAYSNCKANLEFHMFPLGGHGLSLATEETSGGDSKKCSPYIHRWINMLNDWLLLKKVI